MYDVAIIGSGYGGSVLAARLSSEHRVLLVERGKRWDPGQFPHSIVDVASTYMTKKKPLGLWEMRLGKGVGNALVSGFGGASLVNYGITVRPPDHVFDERWPFSPSDLDPYYERARSVMKPSVNPVGDALGDKRFFDMIEPGRRVDLENTIDWDKCTQCGRCCPGCNVGAKRSLDFTYLRDAEQNGAEIRTSTELVRFEQIPSGGWRLWFRPTGGEALDKVETRQLVLSAGTFGTLDLLHKHHSVVPTTANFGQRMTMNGDGVAFLYNMKESLSTHHGAPITTTVRLPFMDPEGKERTLTVMSGRIPFSIMRMSAITMTLLGGNVIGRHRGPSDSIYKRFRRRMRDFLDVGPDGAMANTLMYKLDAEDSGRGQASFNKEGRSTLDWEDYNNDPIVRFAAERLEEWSDKVGGVMIRDLGKWPGMRSFGVHALGGCMLGTSPDDGVVDRSFRLMKPDGSVYDGLRIVDASVIPSSLGVPSSYTIAALAECASDAVLADLAN